MVALGTGMAGAFYSVAEGMLLRPLPFDPRGRLVQVDQRLEPSGTVLMNSQQILDDLRRQSRTLADVAVYQLASGEVTANGQAVYAEGMDVDSQFFPVLGVAPALGREFTPQDDAYGAPATVILSHSFWLRRLGGDPTIIGKNILFNGRPYAVIGVTPRSFNFPFADLTYGVEDFWLPFRLSPGARSENFDKYGIARLNTGVSLSHAQAEMTLISPRLGRAGSGGESRVFILRPYREVVIQDYLAVLSMLAAIVACVLLLMCANVAGLLLADAIGRRRELEVRFALGGRRWQIARLFLFRAFAMALVGGCGGLALAWAAVALVRRLVPAGFPEASQLALDARALWVGGGVSLGTGILFGLWPAMAATRRLDLASLSRTAKAIPPKSTQRWRKSLVTLQLALSASLVGIAALLALSLYRLLVVRPGIRLDHRLTLMVRVADPTLKSAGDVEQIYRAVRGGLLTIPGVRSVAVSSEMPLTPRGSMNFRLKDVPAPKDPRDWMAATEAVGTDYFREMGIGLRKGRVFSGQDRRGGRLVAVVNESFARRFLPGGSVLEKQISMGTRGPWREIVGVIADARDGPIGSPAEPEFFVPFSQSPGLGEAAFTVRTSVTARSLVGTVDRRLRRLPPGLVSVGPFTLTDLRSRQLLGARFRVYFLAAVAVLALLLAGVGVYGVIATAVEQQRHEIGIRVALGASPRRVAALFLRQTFFMLIPALLIGLAAADGLARFVTTVLYGTSPLDPAAYCAAAAVLSAVSVAATALPLRRALRTSLADVLRAE